MVKDVPFGEIAVALGLISRHQLNDCLALQRDRPTRKLGDLCIEKEYLRPDDVLFILDHQAVVRYWLGAGTTGVYFGDIAITLKKLTREQVDECLVLQKGQRDKKLGELCMEKGYMRLRDITIILQHEMLLRRRFGDRAE